MILVPSSSPLTYIIRSMGRLDIILLAVLCFCVFAAEQPYKKIIHNSDPNAKCLDGTSPALYLHEGGDNSKFLIFFVGGGYCAGTTLSQVLEQCYKRSKGDTGSSKDLPDSILSPGGYLSTDTTENRFATWTKFIIFYCDGAHHQGYNKDAISYKDATLYFRGEANTKSHFKWISSQYDFAAAEKVLLTGASSGGIATFSYNNYVRSLLKNPEVLYTVADSGTFMNASNPYTGVYGFSEEAKTLFQISNVDAKSPISICNDKYKGEEYKCLFLQYAFTSIQGRLMLINSEYDEVGLERMGITCLKNTDQTKGKTLANCNATELSYIQDYRRQFMDFITIFMQFSQHSAWTISCCEHSYACYGLRYNVPQLRVPGSTGITPKEAIDRFVFDGERIASVDQVNWPGNTQCAY